MTFRKKEVSLSPSLTNLIREITENRVEEFRQLQSDANTLRKLQKEPIAALCRKFVQVWDGGQQEQIEKTLRIDDPVWDHAYIDQELFALFRHPLVQRLNYIKQLSFAYLTFPSATHSRLSHVLGACSLIDKALDTIFRKNVLYSPTGLGEIPLSSTERRELKLRAKAAALVHDLGHPPFGHALDRLIGFGDASSPKPDPDKFYSRRYIQTRLASVLPPCADAKILSSILSPNATQLSGWETLISALIDSPLDVDRMDFLWRDAHMTGLSEGIAPVEALIEKMTPFQKDDCVFLTFRDPSRAYIEDLLSTRERMYVKCYEHPRKLAAERIFTRLVQSLREKNNLEVEEIILLADDQIMTLLAQSALGCHEDEELLKALIQNIEYQQVFEVDIAGPSSAAKNWTTIREGADGDGKGGRSAYVEMPNQWERMIADMSGIGGARSWQVLVVVPEFKVHKYTEAETLILQQRGDEYLAVPMSEAYVDIEDIINRLRSPRTRFRVFAHPALTEAERKNVREAARRILS